MTDVVTIDIQNIATDITAEHELFMSSMKNTMEAGIKIGELLIEAKQRLPHGEFLPWVNNNLPFTDRTAQKYMKIARKQDILEEKGAKLLSDAYDAIKDNRRTDYNKKHREYDATIDDADSFDDAEDDFFDIEESKIVDKIEEENPTMQRDDIMNYWNDLEKLISGMNYTYRKLSTRRNPQTPRFLGYMIGNIAEMSMRLSTWDPEKMVDCEECKGKGYIPFRDENGNETTTNCPYCINGKRGDYKVTKK